MASKPEYKNKIAKLASTKRVASFASIVSKVDAMSEQERDEFITNFVRSHGLPETINLVRKNLANLSLFSRQAQLYEGFKGQEQDSASMASKETSPSQFRQKLNTAGDWGYLLTILLLVGTAGASDMGGDWKEVLKSFALTIGTGFLSWAMKYLASKMK